MLTIQNKVTTDAAGHSSRALRLENGDSLHSGEFLRRFEGMPEIKKAELIQGKVYMDQDGLVRSRVFPGWQIAPQAILIRNAAADLESLKAGLASRGHMEFLRKLEA